MIKKEFLNLSQSLSSDKNGYQGIWKFWVNGKWGQRIWNQALWSPLWYRFFSKVFVTIPRRFQMIKKQFLSLNQSHFDVIKTAIKAFENFGSTVRGGQRIWNQALWSPLRYRFFSKVFVTIPRRFQVIKKEFLNLNQPHFDVIKTAIKAFENFGSTVRGAKGFEIRPYGPPMVSIFFKSVL